MEKQNTIFGNGKFFKNVLAIAVPIMLQQLIQSMVSLIPYLMVCLVYPREILSLLCL